MINVRKYQGFYVNSMMSCFKTMRFYLDDDGCTVFNLNFYLFLFIAPNQYTCNFTFDKCNWLDDASANFNWTRAQGGTSSQGTGPDGDHTVGASKNLIDILHYILI